MQRIIQINIAGRLIPIEEDAYLILKEYIASLHRHFANEQGKDEIIQDIEYRISELFTTRLNTGAPSIDCADVQKLIETLGAAYTLGAESAPQASPYLPARYEETFRNKNYGGQKRLFRNPNDKMLGGVCSGLANYFDVDPIIMRLIFVTMVFGLGIGFVAYFIAWIIIPVPRTPEELAEMTGGEPLTFHTLKRNVGAELQDLKMKGEEMSRELRDFFAKKK